jgi:hypothetical protein
MALAERHRTIIYQHFVGQIGEEAAEAMLSQFPARDLDEPATKEFVRAEIAELRVEIGRQTERLMTRMQIVVGLGFAAFSAVVLVAR